ncbi:TIGR03067 domain-containing protein [Frigoriglobus tundricola]|uniref:TIGR03067 domain-containing protein n=1 Tax=Frigoriglobus tundricola TaxID=2774151 RepID=A0A6M5YN47_9BACT|nr:TIGR03067 domain-containing protein [Frigoriglobus tundricola]QJW95467.1 hypothetical protein FTUN_3016 [Frigoriglobus tundricola]
MKLVLATGLFSLSLAVALADSPRPDPDGKPDGKPDEKKAAAVLAGGYTIVSGEKDGKPIPPERIKGSVVQFVGNQITGTDKDKKEFFSATFTLDASKTPWVIDMTSKSPKEATATGLIKKEGDTLTIIYSLPGAPAPTEFKTKDKQHLFVLKSMKKADKAPNKP